MVRYLLREEIRRKSSFYYAQVFMPFSLWLQLAEGTIGIRWLVVMSMAMSMSSLLVFVEQPGKGMLVLPVSRRDLWHARWLTAFVLPGALTATGRAAAIALVPLFYANRADTPELFLLATTFELTYWGLLCGLWLARSSQRADPALSLAGRSIDISLGTLLALAAVWPFALYRWLPERWADLRGSAGLVVVTGLLLAAISYICVPGPGTRAFTPVVVTARSARAKASEPWRRGRRIGRLGWLMMPVAGRCALAAMFAVGAIWYGVDTRFPRSDLAFLCAVGLIFARGGWRGRLRQLRTIPLSGYQINALMLATSVALWTTIIATAAAFHAIRPVSDDAVIPPWWWLSLIGTNALADAIELYLPWPWPARLLAVPLWIMPFVVTGTHLGHPSAPASVAWIALGLITFALGAIGNHFALTRSSRLYKSQRSPVIVGL